MEIENELAAAIAGDEEIPEVDLGDEDESVEESPETPDTPPAKETPADEPAKEPETPAFDVEAEA